MNETMDFSETQEEVKPAKKKKGCAGCLGLSLLAMLFLVVGIVAGVSFTMASGLSNRVLLRNVKARTDGEKVDHDAIISKLKTIEALVDQYFLYDVDAEKVENEVYKGYMKGLNDDYAEYYSAQDYKQLMDEDSGEYQGIGVSVYKDPITGFTCVSEVFKDDPAYNAGMKNGDYITSVNGTNTAELTVTEVVSLIKDPAVQVVKLGILRETETLELEVEKKEISLKSVEWEMKSDGIGYISLSQFIETSADDFRKAIDALQKEGMQKLIIDLRDDGGGLVDSCVSILSRILKEGVTIVYTEDRAGNRSQYNSTTSEELNIPMVVLVNGNSASASEIMTGCLKDLKKATIVGQTTYGKGIIQNVIPLSDGSAVKFTILEYLTPNGNKIHKKGITPDVEVKVEDEDWLKIREGKKKDVQLNKAIEILQKQ